MISSSFFVSISQTLAKLPFNIHLLSLSLEYQYQARQIDIKQFKLDLFEDFSCWIVIHSNVTFCRKEPQLYSAIPYFRVRPY